MRATAAGWPLGRSPPTRSPLLGRLSLLLVAALTCCNAQTCTKTVPRYTVAGAFRDTRLATSFQTPAVAAGARAVIGKMAKHGFPDQAATKTPVIIASDATSKVDLRVSEVAVAYMDDGKAPLTDTTGRPIKYATVSVTAPRGTGRMDVAIVQVPCGYGVDSTAIREALSTSLATGRGQTFLPPRTTTLGAVPKAYSATTISTQNKQWAQWEGAVNPGTLNAVGEIYFDEAGDSFSTRELVMTTDIVSKVSSVADGYPDQAATNEDASGATRVCKRRVVNGKYRYYCRRQS